MVISRFMKTFLENVLSKHKKQNKLLLPKYTQKEIRRVK